MTDILDCIEGSTLNMNRFRENARELVTIQDIEEKLGREKTKLK